MHWWSQEERDTNKEKYKTAPYDPRFPNTNQAKRCWVNYIDYWKCVGAKGEGSTACSEFQFAYQEICPPIWTEAWDEQREDGRFPVRSINVGTPKF